MAAPRKYTLKQMLTGEEELQQNIIPQLVAMGQGGQFGYQSLPGAPINPPTAEGGGQGAVDMKGWAALIKRIMGGDQPEELGWPDGNYPTY